jgi:hypothetical protein
MTLVFVVKTFQAAEGDFTRTDFEQHPVQQQNLSYYFYTFVLTLADNAIYAESERGRGVRVLGTNIWQSVADNM